MTLVNEEACESLNIVGILSMVLVDLAFVSKNIVAVAIQERLMKGLLVLIRRDVLAEPVDLGSNKRCLAVGVDAHAVDVVVKGVPSSLN